MCKFCKPDEFGDGKEVFRELKSKPVGVGCISNVMNLEAWLLADNENKPKIQLSLTDQDRYDIAYINIPIKYCPKCGRKLVD